MSRAEQVYGKGVDALFPDGAVSTVAPWPQASRLKHREEFDMGRVQAAVADRSYPLSDVDPRYLARRQPSITRGGVQYYTTPQYDKSGETFAEQHSELNRYPTIYRRENGDNLILSGHHRAAAALAAGRPLRARVVEGPWGASS